MDFYRNSLDWWNSMWNVFNNGLTKGTIGTENGKIIKDEEHSNGARITLEKDANKIPFAITCGIYSIMFHTVYVSNEADFLQKYVNMKEDIHSILGELDENNVSDLISQFVDKY